MTQLAADDFNRADETPLASPWVTPPNWNAFNLAGNAVGPASNGAVMYRGGIAWPNNQWARIVWNGTGTPNGGPAIRISAADGSCYFAAMYSDGTTSIYLWTPGGGYSLLDSVSTGAWVASDALELGAVGTTLKAYKNSAEVLSVVDATLASGNAGMFDFPTADRYDDWSGGDYASGFNPAWARGANVLIAR